MANQWVKARCATSARFVPFEYELVGFVVSCIGTAVLLIRRQTQNFRMSTAHEVIVARHCGMRVFGMSLISNVCISNYDTQQVANHEEVLATGEARKKDLEKLIKALIKQMDA